MKKRNFVDMKRLVALLMIGIMLTTVVGCKSNTVDQEPVDDDAQIEDVVDNPTQDVEKEEVQDELTEIDKNILGIFEYINQKEMPELLVQCEAGDFTDDDGRSGIYSRETPQRYYYEYVLFSFMSFKGDSFRISFSGNDDAYTFHDMSQAGQKKYCELMREFDSQIYDKLLSEDRERMAEEHSWVPYAEEMFQLTDSDFDQAVIEEITKKWLDEPEEPDYENYYRDFYEKLIVPSL